MYKESDFTSQRTPYASLVKPSQWGCWLQEPNGTGKYIMWAKCWGFYIQADGWYSNLWAL